MITQEQIDRFFKDVESLTIRKKQAEIKRRTGYSAGNISDFLNKNKPVSENFIKKFYESFPEISKPEVPWERTGEQKPQNLDSLIATNECLSKAQENFSYAQIKFANAHESLAKDHHDLLQMFKRFISSAETDVVYPASPGATLDVRIPAQKPSSDKQENDSKEKKKKKTGT